MSFKVYEVVMMDRISEDEIEKGTVPVIRVPVTAVAARDEREAILAAGRLLPREIDISNVEVFVRPFCR
jgi:hypothetical protein